MDSALFYWILGIAVVMLVVVINFVARKKISNKKDALDVSEITELFDKENILNIEYTRNKIVISFKDITLFNAEELHNRGVKGINIVGDKIKFYVDDENEVNENIYKAIKAYIEG